MTDVAPGPGRPAVGVVVLNRHGTDDTLACLASLDAATPGAACVVVIENGSTDDSLARLRAVARGDGWLELADDAPLPSPPPQRILVRLSAHRGFSGGNNVGLRLLRDDPRLTHFLLLNNDAELATDYFAAVAEALRAAPDAALLSGTIYEHGDRSRVWYAGGDALPWRALAVHRTARPESDAPVPTEFITGCALLISRPALARLGLLPECYFPAYVEDTEYSHRARAAGLRVLYAPRPTVYHKVGATTRRAALRVVPAYLSARHRGFYARRNLRGIQRAAALLYLASAKPARALVEALSGRPAIAAATLRGLAAGLFSREAWREPSHG